MTVRRRCPFPERHNHPAGPDVPPAPEYPDCTCPNGAQDLRCVRHGLLSRFTQPGPDTDAVRAARERLTDGYIGPSMDHIRQQALADARTLLTEVDRLRALVRKFDDAGAQITRQNDSLHAENRQLRHQISALTSRPYIPEVGAP